MLVRRKLKPATNMVMVRESLGLTRAQVAREASMQGGMVAWIETGRHVPSESQAEKIVGVFRSHGWDGDGSALFDDEVV